MKNHQKNSVPCRYPKAKMQNNNFGSEKLWSESLEMLFFFQMIELNFAVKINFSLHKKKIIEKWMKFGLYKFTSMVPCPLSFRHILNLSFISFKCVVVLCTHVCMHACLLSMHKWYVRSRPKTKFNKKKKRQSAKLGVSEQLNFSFLCVVFVCIFFFLLFLLLPRLVLLLLLFFFSPV